LSSLEDTKTEVEVTSTELGQALGNARRIKGRSLRSVAEGAKISPTYLQKLERGEVSDPSPKVLYRLSEEIGLDYGDLMRRAGYVVPTSSRRTTGSRRPAATTHALSSEPLTDEEETALAAYLRVLRDQKGPAGPGG
jgi:HTH-type transcriptional regulator, competence development regulator